MTTAGIIKLVTPEEREREAQAAHDAAVHAEAVAMLARVTAMAGEHQVAGLTITFVLADGHYGCLIPERTSDMTRLIGAVATMQHELIASVAPERP